MAGPDETTEDLVSDMIEVLTGFYARLYGRRGARDRALSAVTCAKQLPGPATAAAGRADGRWPAVRGPRGLGRAGLALRVAPTTPEQPARIAQHFGARRYAYNWALGQVKANLEARAADPAIAPLAWNF